MAHRDWWLLLAMASIQELPQVDPVVVMWMRMMGSVCPCPPVLLQLYRGLPKVDDRSCTTVSSRHTV
jgi:hypothetical protein